MFPPAKKIANKNKSYKYAEGGSVREKQAEEDIRAQQRIDALRDAEKLQADQIARGGFDPQERRK